MLFFGMIVGSCISMLSHRLPIMLHTAWEEEARAFLKQPAITQAQRYNLFHATFFMPTLSYSNRMV